MILKRSKSPNFGNEALISKWKAILRKRIKSRSEMIALANTIIRNNFFGNKFFIRELKLRIKLENQRKFWLFSVFPPTTKNIFGKLVKIL